MLGLSNLSLVGRPRQLGVRGRPLGVLPRTLGVSNLSLGKIENIITYRGLPRNPKIVFSKDLRSRRRPSDPSSSTSGGRSSTPLDEAFSNGLFESRRVPVDPALERRPGSMARGSTLRPSVGPLEALNPTVDSLSDPRPGRTAVRRSKEWKGPTKIYRSNFVRYRAPAGARPSPGRSKSPLARARSFELRRGSRPRSMADRRTVANLAFPAGAGSKPPGQGAGSRGISKWPNGRNGTTNASVHSDGRAGVVPASADSLLTSVSSTAPLC